MKAKAWHIIFLLLVSLLYSCGGAGGEKSADGLASLSETGSEAAITPQPASKLVQKGIKALPELILSLEYPDNWERHIAARTIGSFGPGAKQAIGALIKSLNDEDPYVRITAARAIRDIDPHDVAGLQALIEIIDDEDLRVREEVGKVIISMAPQAVPSLIKALNHERLDVRIGVMRILGDIGPEQGVVDALSELLKKKDIVLEIRVSAVSALSNYGNEPGIKETLIEALNDNEQQVRLKAIGALGRIGSDASDAVDPLIELFKEEYLSQSRVVICKALGCIGANNIIIEALTEALNDEHPTVRLAAARALAGMGYRAIKPLTEALKNDSPGVRAAAAEALGLIGPPARVSRTALLDAWEDNDLGVAIRATVAMARIGPDTENFLTTLKLALENDDHRMRIGGATGLAMLGPIARTAVLDLRHALEDGSADVRIMACEALGAIGHLAYRAAPDLIKLLEDPDGRVCTAAVSALGKIGPHQGVVEALLEALGADYRDIRFAAAEALGEIGPDAAEAVDELVSILEGSIGDRQHIVCAALAKIGVQAVPPLIEALHNPSFNIRTGAVIALGIIGADAADALPKLKDIADNDLSKSFIIREAALEAIANIGAALAEATADNPQPAI